MSKKIKSVILSLLLLLGFSTSVLAGELKTVTLTVDKMTCSVCPITVKKALKKLDGVDKVVAKYEGKGNGWARVSFDPDKVEIEDLIFTTEMAGYPSHLKQ